MAHPPGRAQAGPTLVSAVRHQPPRHHRAAAPTYFTQPYPADTLLWVAGLAQPDWLIEIDAIALTR